MIISDFVQERLSTSDLVDVYFPFVVKRNFSLNASTIWNIFSVMELMDKMTGHTMEQ